MLHEFSGFPAGLDVGHKFVSRAEMVSIGLHHHWLKGIDYLDNVTDIVSGGFDFKLPRVSLNNHVVDEISLVKIELLIKMLLHCVTPNRNTY